MLVGCDAGDAFAKGVALSGGQRIICRVSWRGHGSETNQQLSGAAFGAQALGHRGRGLMLKIWYGSSLIMSERRAPRIAVIIRGG
jgi:hypothetical protein